MRICAYVFSTILLGASLLLITPHTASGQVIGQCDDHMRRQSFFVYANLTIAQAANPANMGQAIRDPSGMTFMRLPTDNPMLQFWVTWQGQIIQIDPVGRWLPIGECRINVPPQYMPSQPPRPLPPSAFSTIDLGLGVTDVPTSSAQLPKGLMPEGEHFLPPLVPNAELAKRCMDVSGGREDAFLDCVAADALGQRERASYRCLRAATNDDERALCLLRENMGQQERKYLAQAEKCYQQYGQNWGQYPLCMAADQFDERTSRGIQCLQQNAQTGSINYWGMAACYFGPQMGLNQEATVAMECAMASKGQPKLFLICTGGRLAVAELDRCFTNGVGGDDGCFGKNNVFTKHINDVANEIAQHFGEGSLYAKTWRDLTKGPGKNHEAVQFSNNLAREAGNAGEIVRRAVKKVTPRVRIKIKW